MYKALIIVLFLVSTKIGVAHQFQKDHININHPHIKFVISSGPAAGYMKIVNMGFETDRLIKVVTDFADTELHYSNVENGIVTMSKVDFIEIPPQKAKSLKPGTHHIMFSNFSIELKHGISLEGFLVLKMQERSKYFLRLKLKKV